MELVDEGASEIASSEYHTVGTHMDTRATTEDQTAKASSRRGTGATKFQTACSSLTSSHYETVATRPESEDYEMPDRGKGKGRGNSKGKGPLKFKMAEVKTHKTARERVHKDRSKESRPVRVRYIGKGSAFGLKSLLYCTPAECSARAVEHVDLFSFSSAEFVTVLKDFPRVVADIEFTASKEFGKPLKLL